MPVLPNLDPNKPIKTKGLYDAAAAGGLTYEQWQKANPKGVLPSIAPSQVDDTVASQVALLTGTDSKLNQMSRTEGLKAANRRGLLNSSMAVGASQDALLKNVLPIAAQDAAQSYGKNQAARAFEYGMTLQEQQQGFQSKESQLQREFTGTQAGLDRALQTSLQNAQISAADRQQIRQIEATQGIAAAERALQERMQANQQKFQRAENLSERQWQSGENIAARGWQTAENLAQRGFLTTQAGLDRMLQTTLAEMQIDADDARLVKQIASTEGLARANEVLQQRLQEKDIQFRMGEGKLDRASAEKQQKNDILYRQAEGKLDRALQERVANMNLSSADRNAAAQFLVNMESMYQQNYQSIMNNTALDAKSRTNFLTAAKTLRDKQLNLVEQMYNVDLKW